MLCVEAIVGLVAADAGGVSGDVTAILAVMKGVNKDFCNQLYTCNHIRHILQNVKCMILLFTFTGGIQLILREDYYCKV